mmetsp:Transcript_59300/g.165569  ORF Transcript_59300/g.165569 Transcript_59300/m.165569 type:complete len:292 (+) Transcript_59300:66-941(+)
MAPQIEGGWTCVNCGNKNFADRTHCNMRKCGAARPEIGSAPIERPEGRGAALRHEGNNAVVRLEGKGEGKQRLPDWFCGVCGNRNFGDRQFCNMRTCQAPKPGLGAMQQMPQRPQMPLMQQMQPMPQTLPWGTMTGQSPAGGYGKACGKACGGVDGGYGGRCDYGKAYGDGECGKSTEQAAKGCGPYERKGGSGGGRSDVEREPRSGDWVCPACQNINYSDRAFCNMRKCGVARTLTEWRCPECGNMNFPDRMSCNMRKCGAARPDIDPKAVMELMAKGLGKGAFGGKAKA